MVNDNVNHPSHYVRPEGGPECIDSIESALSEEEFRGFVKGNVMKYLWRERHKGKDEDVAKAKWYLDRLKQYYEVRHKYGPGQVQCK